MKKILFENGFELLSDMYKNPERKGELPYRKLLTIARKL